MPYARKPDLTDALAHLDAFWAGRSLGRPAMFAASLNPQHAPNRYGGPAEAPMAAEFNAERIAWNAVDCLEGAIFHAEALPAVSINIGSGLAFLPHLAGGTYRYDGKQAWIERTPELLTGPLPRFDPAAPAAARLKACYAAARQSIGPRGYVNPPLMIDPLTALSQMLGEEEMALDLAAEPERVQPWLDALTNLYVDAFAHFCSVSGNAHSTIFFGPSTAGRAEALQCDFAVMLSPDMFGQFALPCLRRMAAGMSRTLYHLDGVEQMRFLDQLATIENLRGIQWNPQTDFGRPTRHVENLQAIRARGLLLFVFVDDLDEAVAITRVLGPDGLFLKFRRYFESPAEAEDAIARVAAVC